MQLEQFIETSLIAICNGIEKAKAKLNSNNAIVAPGKVEGINVTELRFIDFQVSVIINKSNQIEVMGDVMSQINAIVLKGGANIGGKFDHTSAHQFENKICFSVPYIPEGIGYVRKK